MSPPICLVLIMCVVFGTLTSVFMVVPLSTDYWENMRFDVDKLRSNPYMVKDESIINEEQGFYKMVMTGDHYGNRTTIVLKTSYGGIWRFCDMMTDQFRNDEIFTKALAEVNNKATTTVMKDKCFNYITDYGNLERKVVEDSSLFRVQNSAASCGIVGVLCLGAAVITGVFGVWQRQLSACMITGVMYIVAGVFECFSLIIMLTKMSYLQSKCFRLETTDLHEDICPARIIYSGWAMPIAWVGFSMSFLALGSWLLMARCFRLEAAKSMV